MRLPTLLNWMLLTVNVLTFAFLLCFSLMPPWPPPWNPSVRRAQADANVMGMDVFCARSPFAISVAKDFSGSGSFMFIRYGQPISLLTQPVEEENGGATSSAAMMLGHEVVISAKHSYSSGGACQVHALSLMRWIGGRNEQFVDENADGSYDTRHVRDLKTQTGCDYVFYEGDWQEVAEVVGYYRSRLVDGQVVSFDMESGKWCSVRDE